MNRTLLEELAKKYGFTPEERAGLSLVDPTMTLAGALEELAAPPPAPAQPHDPGDRYQHLAPLGRGGMGEVHRVWDRVLERAVAMKIILPARSSAAAARFEQEARLAAQLQHPGIVAVYDLGSLGDGRFYLTMEEIRGQTLDQLISDGPGTRRLLELLARVCEAVAHAHSQGVLHRDLKPANVMVVSGSSIKLVDWGLSLQAQAPLPPDGAPRAPRSANATSYQGTPAYMAPELLAVPPQVPTVAADVYALGVVLYRILAGQLPFSSPVFLTQQLRIQRGELAPAPLPEPTPPLLAALCLRSLAPTPSERPTAAELAQALQAHLDGEQQREVALALVDEADDMLRSLRAQQQQAADAEASGKASLKDIPRSAPSSEKAPAWSKLDHAQALREASWRAEMRYLERLQQALTLSPGLESAHERLARWHRERLDAAEASNNTEASVRALAGLEAHDLGSHRAHRRGDGALSLVTEPPGARVALFRYTERQRRLVPTPMPDLGTTPLSAVPLPMGSYLLELHHPDCETVRYPVHITRQHHWDGVRPGSTEATPIRLPPRGSLGQDEVYVPPGWFARGQDPETNARLHDRVWVDGVVFSRHPVTTAQYLAFLDALASGGHADDAWRLAPHIPGSAKDDNILLVEQGPSGRFRVAVPPGERGPTPDTPMVRVSWAGAHAYCQWLKTQRPGAWRLPGEWEWEKAARGVDGRPFPWGRFGDEAWACTRHSHADSVPFPCPISAFPEDESVYGVRHVGGNVRNWCGDADIWGAPTDDGIARVPDPDDPTPHRLMRGGGWDHFITHSRCAWRHYNSLVGTSRTCGVRPVRSHP